jgi:hypothetical protein
MDSIKKFSPAAFAIIIICFFLPFVNLTCSGQTVMSLTGIQLITGAEYKPQGMFNQEEMFDNQPEQQTGLKTSGQDIEAQPMAFFALLFAVVGLILSFIKNRIMAIICTVASVLGAVCMLLLKANIDGDASMQGQGVIQIEYQFGYWLAFLLFIAVAVLSWFNTKESAGPVTISGLPSS